MTLPYFLARFRCFLLLVLDVALQVIFAVELFVPLARWLHLLFRALLELFVQFNEALPPEVARLRIFTFL